jgi:hypothetical protein
MVAKQFAKQMLDLQKTTLDQSYNVMLAMQDQSEKLMQGVMEQAAWIPDESKMVVKGWINALKKSESDCKQMMDDYFASIENFFVVPETTQPSEASKAANKATAVKSKA